MLHASCCAALFSSNCEISPLVVIKRMAEPSSFTIVKLFIFIIRFMNRRKVPLWILPRHTMRRRSCSRRARPSSGAPRRASSTRCSVLICAFRPNPTSTFFQIFCIRSFPQLRFDCDRRTSHWSDSSYGYLVPPSRNTARLRNTTSSAPSSTSSAAPLPLP